MVRFMSDPRIVDRSGPAVPLSVVAVGLPRCATSSLQSAFEILGFNPSMHMANILPHADRCRTLLAAMHVPGHPGDTGDPTHRGRRHALLRELTAGHAALSDLPATYFHADLMDMYPGVRVVLNVRRGGGEVWARSCGDSLMFFFTRWFWLTGLPFETDRLWYRMNMRNLEYFGEKFLGPGSTMTKERIMSAEMYDRHNEDVRRTAKERGVEILEWTAEDGWEPLCGFLGKEVPRGQDGEVLEFPRTNEAAVFHTIKMMFIVRGVLVYAAAGAGIWASWRFGSEALRVVSGFVGEWLK